MKKIFLLAVLCVSCLSISVSAGWEHASNGGNFTMSGSVQSSEAVITPRVVNVGKSTEEFTIDALKTEKAATVALTKTLPVIDVRTAKLTTGAVIAYKSHLLQNFCGFPHTTPR